MLDEDLKQEYTKDWIKETLTFRKDKLNEIFPDGFDKEKLTDALYNSIHKDDDMKYANNFFTNLEEYILKMENAHSELENIPFEESAFMSEGEVDEYYEQQRTSKEKFYDDAQYLKEEMNKQLEELSVDWLHGDQEADYYKENHIKRIESNELEIQSGKKAETSYDTRQVLDSFYEECVKFWDKEKERGFSSNKNPKELALQDVEFITKNPNGELLDETTKQNWMNEKKFELNKESKEKFDSKNKGVEMER